MLLVDILQVMQKHSHLQNGYKKKRPVQRQPCDNTHCRLFKKKKVRRKHKFMVHK